MYCFTNIYVCLIKVLLYVATYMTLSINQLMKISFGQRYKEIFYYHTSIALF